jgi:hypothetical protein
MAKVVTDLLDATADVAGLQGSCKHKQNIQNVNDHLQSCRHRQGQAGQHANGKWSSGWPLLLTTQDFLPRHLNGLGVHLELIAEDY